MFLNNGPKGKNLDMGDVQQYYKTRVKLLLKLRCLINESKFKASIKNIYNSNTAVKYLAM